MMTKLVYVARPTGGMPLGMVLECLPSTITASIMDVTYDTSGYLAEVELTYDPNEVSFTYWAIQLLG